MMELGVALPTFGTHASPESGDLAELDSLGADHVFWGVSDAEPDDQLHYLEQLLAQVRVN
jgi:hypothetical protein